MPHRCIAANCSNVSSDTISLFKFPCEKTDAARRKLWVENVRRTRDRPAPGEKLWTPSDYSRLCSAHFTEDCFDPSPGLKMTLGISVQHSRLLLTDAVPTIFPRKTAPKPRKRRRSQAVAKRARLEILKSCLSTDPEEDGASSTEVVEEEWSTLSAVDVTTSESRSNDFAVQVKPETKGRGVQTKKGVGTCKGLQVNPPMTESAVQSVPTMTTTASQTDMKLIDWLNDTDSQMSMSVEDDMSVRDEDPDYEPSSDESDDEGHTWEGTCDPQPAEQKRDIFLVFWSCLVQLFSVWCSCVECGYRELLWSCKVIGTSLQVTFKCTECGKEGTWKSQPSYGRTAAGNILLSAGILFAGAGPTKVLRVLSHMGVAIMSIRSFFRHQQQVLLKAVQTLWKERQTWMMSTLQVEDEPIVCGGDGRADTPGHCAKYGTYTLMELKQTAVIDIQLVQSNEVGGSYHMEKRGLERSLEYVEEFVDVGTLVTDRHVGINKMIREDHPLIKHLFDVWHVAKSIKKKLLRLSLKKECDVLKHWVGSIINHLHWSVISTPAGNGDLILAKWLSVLEHVQNKHSGFEGLFPSCGHGPLEGREKRKPWLKPHSKVVQELEKIITNQRLCKDIKRLSPAYQTSYLEAFHSLILHFAPKTFHFSFVGMESRVMLAALHFNENAHRAQARTKDGSSIFSIHFPKYKKGDYIVRKVLEKPTYGYVEELVEMVKQFCKGEEYAGDVEEDDVMAGPVPDPLSASCEKPSKQEAIRRHLSRFPPPAE